MRALLVLALLAGGVARADKVDPLDACMSREIDLKVENAQLRQALAQLQLRLKYKIGAGDSVDAKTLEIKRAAKKK